jgi:hypothetical protein
MKKLFKLKQWHTIEDAATHLSELLGESVTTADIYRLGLDGHLTISVNFVNHAQANVGAIEGPDSARWIEFPNWEFLHQAKTEQFAEGKPEKILLSLPFGKDSYLNFKSNVSSINGIWDLMMIGAETLDIEHHYQMLTGGPEVTLCSIDGVFVRNGDVICKVLESFDDNQFQKGSEAQGKDIERHILESNLPMEEAKAIRAKHKEERNKYLKNRLDAPNENDYYPAGGIPKDAVLVVRTDAMLSFLQAINEEPSKSQKPLSTKERNTLLVLLAALCKEGKIDYKKPGMAAAVAKMTENIGSPISDDTIRNVFKQIDEALDARNK